MPVMSQAVLYQYLALGAVLFVLGLIGFVARRNMILIFLSTEIMFQGVAVNLIAFSRYWMNMDGQSFVIFLLTIAAAEASLALGLVILLFRRRETLDVDVWSEMQG
jgi:NADH-quinone oxidoreductase subunit K